MSDLSAKAENNIPIAHRKGRAENASARERNEGRGAWLDVRLTRMRRTTQLALVNGEVGRLVLSCGQDCCASAIEERLTSFEHWPSSQTDVVRVQRGYDKASQDEDEVEVEEVEAKSTNVIVPAAISKDFVLKVIVFYTQEILLSSSSGRPSTVRHRLLSECLKTTQLCARAIDFLLRRRRRRR